jgi:hypothetical protein
MRGLSEIVPIQDVFCSGLGAIERLEGGLFRFWIFVTHRSDEDGVEKIVVSKLVMSKVALPELAQKVAAAVAEEEPSLAPQGELMH